MYLYLLYTSSDWGGLLDATQQQHKAINLIPRKWPFIWSNVQKTLFVGDVNIKQMHKMPYFVWLPHTFLEHKMSEWEHRGQT